MSNKTVEVGLKISGDAKGGVAAAEATGKALGAIDPAAKRTEQSIKSLDAQMNKLGIRSADQINADILEVNQALQGLAGQANLTGEEFDRAFAAAQQRLADLKHETNEAGDAVEDAGFRLNKLTAAVAGLFAASKIKNYAIDTIAVADAYGQMASRIEKATASQEEYEYVQKRLLETAAGTYRPLAEAQEMYIRTADALRDLGYNTQQALDIGDSFSYMLVSDAASADKAANAINAYTKSIQSGKIEVDAWQSMLVATPSLVEAIATSTGKSNEEVRRLGITGKLAIRDLNEGLRQTRDLNKAVADSMPTTVADAVTRLSTVWSAYIGEANRANGATARVVEKINLLSENLESVVKAATLAGHVVVAVFAVRALNALQTYIAALIVAERQTNALTMSTTAAVKQAGLLATAGRLAAAGWLGWEIGKYLKDEFLVVEQLGIALAAGLTKTAARAQAAWEMIKAPFTDDTIEAAYGRLQSRLAEIDNTYAELFAEAEKNRQASEGGAKAADGQAAALGRLGAAASAVATQLAITSDELLKMSAADIGKLGNELQEAYRRGEISAGQFAQVNDQIVLASLERLGVDASAAMDRVSAGTLNAIADIENLAAAMDGAIYSAESVSSALEMAFSKSLQAAKSEADIVALSNAVKGLRESGRIGEVSMTRLADAAEAARRRIEGIVPGIQSVEEAFKSLGVVSDAELKRQADAAKEAYEKIKKSGVASAREIQEAFSKYAERAIAANGGVAGDALRVEAAMVGVKLSTDKVAESAERAAGEYKKIANSATEAKDAVDELRAAAAAGYQSPSAGVDFSGLAKGRGAKGDQIAAVSEAAAKIYAEMIAEKSPDALITPMIQSAMMSKAVDAAIAEALAKQQKGDSLPVTDRQQSLSGSGRSGYTPMSQTFTVKLDLGAGRGDSFNFSSSRDAESATAMIRSLERAAKGSY